MPTADIAVHGPQVVEPPCAETHRVPPLPVDGGDERVASDVPYVGLMGPTERFERIADELRAEGRELSQSELDRLYTPVGLDLGGGAPYQIAHSIVAELLAVRHGRTPAHLRGEFAATLSQS